MDTLSTILLGTTLLCGGLAFVLFETYRRSQSALLRAEGERSAAVAERDIGHAEKRRLESDIVQLRQAQETATRHAAVAEQQVALMTQEVATADRRMKEFEAQEKRIVESAKAAVVDTAHQLSTKLLADHKQENEQAKKQAAEVTAKLFEQFHHVTGKVEAMHREGEGIKGRMDVIARVLASPGGAGRHNEINLENVLKSFGFMPGIDFDMQYHMQGEEGGLRPDAIVYLPQNIVLVIDCKASQFVMQMAEAEGAEGEAAKFDQLRKTMHQHVKALAHKNYAAALKSHYKSKGRAEDISEVLSLMYFHHEGMIDRLKSEDAALEMLLREHRIMLVGPTVLYGVCGLAHSRIAEAQQAEKHEEIIEAVSALMEHVADLFAEVGTMGGSIHKLSKVYNSLAAKMNRNALARMKRLGKLKVTPAKGKAIPAPLATYDVTKHDEMLELEADEERVDEKVLAIRQG